MDGINPEAASYAISLIDDGTVFESFAQDFLSKCLGYQFVPVGGIQDRGIDGLEHTYCRKDSKTIYQMSIQKDYRSKIDDSLDKLITNKIKFNQFVYVTNQAIPDIDQLKDRLIEKYNKAVNIFDRKWFSYHVNDTENTVRSFQIFIESHLHEFNRPGKSYEVANLIDDPRIYTYLRQQIDELRNVQKLDQILVDTLILYSLEDTDPDRGVFLTKEDIIDRVQKLVKFDPHQLKQLIKPRLRILSTKPRRINYHKKERAYCLQHEERLRIQNHNLKDALLLSEFIDETQAIIERIVPSKLIDQIDFNTLVFDLLNRIYYIQGLEFSDFVLHDGSSSKTLQKNLPDLVSDIVEAGKFSHKLTEIKQYLLTIIRSIVYDGTLNQKAFLKRLSLTYSMLFMLQCDPKLCTYFSALANKLNIYVCTSIIIPALSERFLEPHNRRFTNLLVSAQQTGVKLYINEAILSELAAHFRMIRQIYEEDYRDNDRIYSDESAMYTIQHILIRAYYYALNRKQVRNFDHYISTFAAPRMDRLDEDLILWLQHEFGIQYVPNENLGIHLDQGELNRIASKLSRYKWGPEEASRAKAKSDAEVILAIFAIRERNNEISVSGIFGYHTWWLTSDITTQKAATETLGKKYAISCYMRPDFLYNYISVAPTKGQIDETFLDMFPTLLGVNISTYLPSNISAIIHKYVKEHAEESEVRKASLIRELIDDLKQDPANQTEAYVKNKVSKWHKPRRS